MNMVWQGGSRFESPWKKAQPFETGAWGIRRNVYLIAPIVLLVLLIAVSNTIGQSGSLGAIKGEVTTNGPDGGKVALPGAKLILEPAQSTPKVALSADDLGHYQFSDIEPGTYRLEAALEGFAPFSKMVVIGAGQFVTEDIRLEIDAVSASVTITSDTGGINVTDSSITETIGSSDLQTTPLLEEKFQEALPLIPGVVRGPDGLINIKGAAAAQSGTLLGSSNGDDPVTGNMAIDLPLEAVESVQVVSNPYSAEFGNFSGGVVQVQTRSGSNDWDFRFTNFFPRLRKRGGSLRGVESIKPRFNLGGPLKKDKLFIFQSFEYKFVQTRVESLPQLESDTKLESFDSFTRIDYNFSDSHRMNATFALFPQKLDFVNLNTFNPQTTAANLHQRGWMAAVNDQYVTSEGGILQSTFSVKRSDANVFGNSDAPFTIAPQVNSGGFFNRQERESLRYEAQTIYSLPVAAWNGQHLVKFGGGFSYTSFDGLSTNSDVRIVRGDGSLNQIQTYLGEGALSRNKSEIGAFVHDKWIINPHLSLDLGVRLDRDSLGKRLNPAPRAGFVFSPFDDNKTVIRGGVGLFFSKIPLNVGIFEQGQTVEISRFGTDGTTLLGQTLFSNVLEDSDIETPYSIGWNLQLEREITDRLLVRVGYEQRETLRDFILDPILLPGEREGAYRLSNRGESSYREFQIMARVRLQENRDLFFSYTRSRAAGDLNTFGSFAGNIQTPILRPNEYSRLSFDAPNRFLFWGDIGLPFGLTLTPVIDWRTGFPYSIVDEKQDFIGPRNSGRRFPDFFSADVQILKDFKVGFRGKEYTLRAGVKFFNLTNHFNPRDVQSNIDSPDFGSLYNGVGRRTRFKFEIVL